MEDGSGGKGKGKGNRSPRGRRSIGSSPRNSNTGKRPKQKKKKAADAGEEEASKMPATADAAPRTLVAAVPKNGVDDMILLPNVKDDGITENIRKRFDDSQIYTWIGEVLISVNPYRFIPGMYDPEVLQKHAMKHRYMLTNLNHVFLNTLHMNRYEMAPHVYMLAEMAYRQMLKEDESQCIIISGESGAGKTEASKKVMEYVAAVSGSGDGVEKVKQVILESNPLLEAFGNAKTLRNNNSSRFGKYFEIEFDYAGRPCGGKINNYLLEKSRVVGQLKNERNFHIFYQFCKGAGGKLREQCKVKGCDQFKYLSRSGCYDVEGIDDIAEYNDTRHYHP